MKPHQPRKRFGQHFLHDGEVVAHILSAFDPQPDQRIIEIGPGTGALTVPLLQCLSQLEVVELDRDLVARLRHSQPALIVYQADALNFDFAALRGNDPRLLRIIGNLPYNISTPLLFHLLAQYQHIRDMLFMLQKEVVERITAAPGESAYGRLSVMLQVACEAHYLLTVAAESFTPPPQVESAVVLLQPYSISPYDTGNKQHFAQVVAQAFNQRRKTLRNSLKGIIDAETFAAAEVEPSERPENVSVAQFAKLARLSWHKMERANMPAPN